MPGTRTIGQPATESVDTIAQDQLLPSVDESAFEATILALNAAVDAARAGEAGIVFAVGEALVADSVHADRARGFVTYLRTASSVDH